MNGVMHDDRISIKSNSAAKIKIKSKIIINNNKEIESIEG